MPSKYFTILTNIGSALHANAQIQQTKVPWTHMALGDGGGVEVQPDQKQTALVREVHRLPITAIDSHPTNPNWIVVEAVVPNNVGGWTVRETAIYGGTGVAQCIAVGNYPASYKPVIAEGAVREMVMRMIVEISSTATVNLVIDPAVAIASRQFVEEFVGKELQKLDSKQSVRVATTANIVLSGLQNVDGIALAAGDRVLVKDQASGKDNGIYTAAAGAWSRAIDADTSAKVTPELSVGVEQGAVNADSAWMLTTDAPIVLSTTALVFEISGGRPMATKSWVQGLVASEIDAGISKSASQAETNEGLIDGKFVSPKKLRAGFSASFGLNGFVAFPSWLGGLVIQWGRYLATGNSTTTVTMPTSFPNEFVGVIIGILDNEANAASFPFSTGLPVTRGTFSLRSYYSASPITNFYIALGR